MFPKMNWKLITRRSFYLVAAIAALTGVGYWGYTLGLDAGVQEAYFCNAFHTSNYVKTLRYLKGNQLPGLVDMLETNIDAGVVLITPKNAVLTDRANKFVQDTLGEVKSYRSQYPWTGSSPWLSLRVESALSNVESKPSKVCP